MLNILSTKIPKSWIVVTVVFAALIGYIYFQKYRIDTMDSKLTMSYTEIGSLNNNIKQLEVEVKMQQDSIDLMRKNFDDVAKINSDLQKTIIDIREDTNNVIRDYNSYKIRLRDITIEKPTLIERRINSSTSDILREFENATARTIIE